MKKCFTSQCALEPGRHGVNVVAAPPRRFLLCHGLLSGCHFHKFVTFFRSNFSLITSQFFHFWKKNVMATEQ